MGTHLVKGDCNQRQQCDLYGPEAAIGFIAGFLKWNDCSEGCAGQQSPDVGGIIDCRNREADNEVDDDNRENSGSNGALEKRRDRIPIPDTKCQKHTEQAEDGA